MKKYANTYLDKIETLKKVKNISVAKESILNVVKQVKVDAKKGIKEAIVAYCCLQITGYKIEKNANAGRERLMKMVNLHSLEAVYFVAIASSYGEFGFIQDQVRGEQWAREVALSEDSEICNIKRANAAKVVADLYRNGLIVKVDLAEASRFYELACLNGCSESSLMLGKVLIRGAEGVFGTLVEADESRGLALLSTVAKEGNVEAAEELVKYYLTKSVSTCDLVNSKSDLLTLIKKTIDGVEWALH